MMDEENIEPLLNSSSSRKALEPISANGVNKTALRKRQSSIGFDSSNCSKRLTVLLAEKEKQLTNLEQRLLISQSEVQELQAGSDKFKRQEREAKKALSSRESHLKRQSVALKYTNDKLQSYVRKEDDKIRRSTMERKVRYIRLHECQIMLL